MDELEAGGRRPNAVWLAELRGAPEPQVRALAHERCVGHSPGTASEREMAAVGNHDERAERWRAWMAAAQQGDAEDYGRLFAELHPFVRGLVRGRLGGDPAVEDVTQEVLMRIHTSCHTYRAERPLLPWVRTIARNAVIDQARRRTLALCRSSDVEPEEIPVDPPELPGSDRLSPAIEEALERLPQTQREAVWMLKIDGLSVSEAAERAGVTSGALKLRAHRGRCSLRDLLGGAARRSERLGPTGHGREHR